MNVLIVLLLALLGANQVFLTKKIKPERNLNKLHEKLYAKLAKGMHKYATIIQDYQNPEFRIYNTISIPILNFTKPRDFIPNQRNCLPDSFCPEQIYLSYRTYMIPTIRSYKMCSCKKCFHEQGPCGRKVMSRDKAGCEEEFGYSLALILTNYKDVYNLDSWQFVLEQVPITCKCSMMNSYGT